MLPISITSLVLFTPLLASCLLFISETLASNHIRFLSKRAYICIFFGILAIAISISISSFLMTQFIDFYSLFGFKSVSDSSKSLVVKLITTIVVLDFANYLIHRFIHFVPTLWKFHRLHHSDKNVDSMTTLLHHPLEVLTNSVFIIGFYVIFDLPIIFVIFYDILLGAHDAFAHTTIKIPPLMEKWLGFFFVMPNMHRTHHALDLRYGNSNYGSIFSIWDRLLGTYTFLDNVDSHLIVFGVEKSKSPKELTIRECLINPFI